jgi:mono/diheme cytochrome c family protein
MNAEAFAKRALSPARIDSMSWKTWTLIVITAAEAACASMPRGASDANLAKARSGAPDGASSYQHNCAGCHGERGESTGRAPRIMGEGALPELPQEYNANADPAAGDPELLRLRAQTRPAGAPSRDPFRTADDVYRYVSKNMPLPVDKAGSLSAEEYWAIVNFMLLGHGVPVPPEGVTAANASSVKL